MTSKEIRELIELISTSNFASFELEREGFKIKLVREPPAAPWAAARSAEVMLPPPSGPAVVPAALAPAEPAAAPPSVAPAEALVELRSPIVGTFYTAAGPASAPLVEVGSKVKKGHVMCIVEAMKVMNEIESEIDAEVVEIVVANGQPVEYGEVLFRLRPA